MHQGNTIHIQQRTAEEIAESRIGPIRFASSIRSRDRPKKEHFTATVQITTLSATLLSGPVCVWLFLMLTGLRMHPHGELFVGIVVSLIATAIAFWRLWESYGCSGFRWRGRHLAVAAEEDRIVCLGGPARVCTVGPLEDIPFEPKFFNASHVFRGNRLQRYATWAVGATLCVGAILIHVKSESLQSSAGARLLGALGMSLVTSLLMGIVLLIERWMFRVYLRIAPGKLDILRYRFLGNEVGETESFDLTRARVIVDADNGVVGITDGDRHVNITYDAIRHKRFVPYCILLAAISTHMPGSDDVRDSSVSLTRRGAA